MERKNGSSPMVKLEPEALRQVELFQERAERLLALKLSRAQAVAMLLKAGATKPFAEGFRVEEESDTQEEVNL